MLRCEWKHRKYQCFLTLVKKHCKLQCFWPPDPQKPWYLQWFLLLTAQNTVNNSNFAVFSCFSLFFELRWSAIHGYQILRVFFSDNQYFRMFWSQWPTSLAVTSGCPTMRCGRLPSRSDVNILQFYQIIVPIISIIYIYVYIYIYYYVYQIWNRPNVLAESSETIETNSKKRLWTIMTNLQNTGIIMKHLPSMNYYGNSSTRHSPIMMIYDGYSLI